MYTLLQEPRYDRKRPEPETETGARPRGPGRQARGLERARGRSARARAAPAARSEARDSECVSRGGGGGGGGMRSPAPLARWRYNSKVWRGRDQQQPQHAGSPDPRTPRPHFRKKRAEGGAGTWPAPVVSRAPGYASVASARRRPAPLVCDADTFARWDVATCDVQKAPRVFSSRLGSREGSLGDRIRSSCGAEPYRGPGTAWY